MSGLTYRGLVRVLESSPATFVLLGAYDFALPLGLCQCDIQNAVLDAQGAAGQEERSAAQAHMASTAAFTASVIVETAKKKLQVAMQAMHPPPPWAQPHPGMRGAPSAGTGLATGLPPEEDTEFQDLASARPGREASTFILVAEETVSAARELEALLNAMESPLPAIEERRRLEAE